MWNWLVGAAGSLWGAIRGNSNPINLKLLFILFNSGNITVNQIEQELVLKGKPEKKKNIEAGLKLLCSQHLIEKKDGCKYELTTLGRDYLAHEIETILI